MGCGAKSNQMFKCTQCNTTFKGSGSCGKQKCPKCGTGDWVLTAGSKVKKEDLISITVRPIQK